MKICIYGIKGLYNYGCEAMVRTISAELKSNYPNSEIVYESFDYVRDLEILSDCETVIVDKVKDNNCGYIEHLMRYFRRKLSIAKPEDYIHFDRSWMSDCDVLIVIGGDVFDLTPEQKKANKYINDRMFVSEIVKKNGGKVYLWGISVGDFDCNQNAKNTLISYFNKYVDYAIIRDKKSFMYLKENGVDKVALCSDPAFVQRTIQKDDTTTGILGINLSPLANRYLKSSKTEREWVEYWADAINIICERLSYKRVMFIPHVVNDQDLRDDDLKYLEKLNLELKKYEIDSQIISQKKGFLSIKEELVKCDMLLAARMHCAVNSITCGVPTVFLSYSPKSKGMCEHVYGSCEMFFDMNDLLNEDNLKRLESINLKLGDIKLYLAQRNSDLMIDAQNAINKIEIHRS